jgi:hypothetical protein
MALARCGYAPDEQGTLAGGFAPVVALEDTRIKDQKS